MKNKVYHIEKNEGMISYVQRMSLHDGPGVRTTVFFKGCNLRCKWCHNPETFTSEVDLNWIQSRCIDCGICMSTCQGHALSFANGRMVRENRACIQCYTCVSECYAEAWELVGKRFTVKELCEKICDEKNSFDRSGGGVTFSGGEPMIQFEYLHEVLKKLNEFGIHRMLQTNMTCDWDKYEKIMPYVDSFMCDLKHVNFDKHNFWVGSSNVQILNNFMKMDASGASYCVRTPVIPGVNDTEGELREIASFVRSLKNAEYYELLPFHSLGGYKYENLGLNYEFAHVKEISMQRMEELKRQFELIKK